MANLATIIWLKDLSNVELRVIGRVSDHPPTSLALARRSVIPAQWSGDRRSVES